MSDSKIDYINPYSKLAQQYQAGLDAIITDIGTGGPGTVTINQLTEAVYDYIVSVFTDLGSSPEGEASVKAMVANAINGYLDNGGSSPFLSVLQAVPPVALGNQFDRLFDASRAARVLRGNAGRQQMTIALGQADAQYWGTQIATTGSWVAYMSGNEAIDTASVPYWTDAAMFGAQFDYYQVNGTDARATSMVFASALTGALAVSAGKMVFGWVPKVGAMATGIVTVSEDCGCDTSNAKMMSNGMSQIGKPVHNSSAVRPTTWQREDGAGGNDTRYYVQGKRNCQFFYNWNGNGSTYIDGDNCAETAE